jgi:hypothetical protein
MLGRNGEYSGVLGTTRGTRGVLDGCSRGTRGYSTGTRRVLDGYSTGTRRVLDGVLVEVALGRHGVSPRGVAVGWSIGVCAQTGMEAEIYGREAYALRAARYGNSERLDRYVCICIRRQKVMQI